MKNLVVALVAFAFAASAATAGQNLAPAVKRKPAVTVAPRQDFAAPAATPTAPPAPAEPVAAPSTAPVAPQRAARMTSERDVRAALTTVAAQGGGESALDAGLVKAMSGLVVAGRCSEAAGLAAQDGRTTLASHASKLCR